MSYMKRCYNCDRVMDVGDLRLDYTDGGYYGEAHWTCPYCGGDDLGDVEQCTRCGEVYDPDEDSVFGTSGSELCLSCIQEVADVRTGIDYGADTATDVSVNGLFAYVFSPEDINEILKKAFMELPAKKQKSFIDYYIECDYNEFADWFQSYSE